MLAAELGNSESDPKKIADVVVRLANTEHVPKRLVVGKDGETYVKQAETARAEEAAKYRELSYRQDFRMRWQLPDRCRRRKWRLSLAARHLIVPYYF